MMKLLIENGALVNGQDMVGATPLMYSCWAAHTPCVQLLLDQGADTTICTQADQLSPLHAAALSGRIACVGALHEKGAQINAKDIDGATPLHKAACRGDVNIVSFLLEVGAPANTTDKEGNTPLHCMAQSGSVACLQCAADMHKNIGLDFASASGLRPLHVSAFAGHSDFTAALIELGADVNVAANDGSTPLHFACESGDERAVEALLAAKANPMTCDGTWLMCARVSCDSCVCVRVCVLNLFFFVSLDIVGIVKDSAFFFLIHPERPLMCFHSVC
jgi:ankyrin repeat protein